MAQRGGKREGAGRPKGAKDRSTREQGATLGELARSHTDTAMKALVAIVTSGQSEAAVIAAANAILDRGYGKAPQSLEVSGPGGNPVRVDLSNLTIEEKMALAKVKIADE